MNSAVPEVVLFDAGQTLVRTALPVGHYYCEMAAHYGHQGDPERLHREFLRAWKQAGDEGPVEGERVTDERRWWRRVVLESWAHHPFPGHFPFDHYFDEVFALFARPDVWRVYPDARLALEQLRARGVRCGILSNWDARLRDLVEGLELASCFEHLIISAEVGAEKPSPRIFEHACERFGVAPDRVLLIGDDPVRDGEGARRAGCRVGLVDRPHTDILTILAGHGLAVAS